MFDFGADARNEGGENGQNHKGLVTFDRKYKKDSFYAYKAWLSDEKFVHICGKRYVDRVEDITKVTIYSNLPEVELFANGKSLGKKASAEHFFYFDVPNCGETELVAVAGEYKDSSFIRKVEEFNPDYRLREKGAVLNWFDITEVDGYFSLNDRLSDIVQTQEGAAFFKGLAGQMMKGLGNTQVDSEQMGGMMMQMMGSFTVLRLTSLMGAANIKFSKEQLLGINAQLNKIKKP
jgi:beta-galactosidase